MEGVLHLKASITMKITYTKEINGTLYNTETLSESKSFHYVLKNDAFATETQEAYNTAKAFYTAMPQFGLTDNYYFHDADAGTHAVIAAGNDGTPPMLYVMPNASNAKAIPYALPAFDSLELALYRDGKLWLKSTSYDDALGTEVTGYHQFSQGQWLESSAAEFAEVQAVVQRPGSIARAGKASIDMDIVLESASSGLSTEVEAEHVSALGNDLFLVQARVDSKTSAIGHDQWLVVDNHTAVGTIVHNEAFSLDEDAVVRAVSDNDSGAVWFQIINAKVVNGQLSGQNADQAVSLYRMLNAKVAAAMASVGEYGASILPEFAEPVAEPVRKFSIAELTAGRGVQSGETVWIKQFNPVAPGESNKAGFVISETRSSTNEVLHGYFVHLDSSGAVDNSMLLPAPLDRTLELPTVGTLLLTEADATGYAHVYRVNTSTGSLTELTLEAYKDLMAGNLGVLTLDAGTEGADILTGASAATIKLTVAANGNDTINAGTGKDIIGGGLGPDRVVYTSAAQLAGDAVDGGLERTSRDALVLNPGTAGVNFDLGTANVQHIDQIVIQADLATQVGLTRSLVARADFNGNGTLGDIGVINTATATQTVALDGGGSTTTLTGMTAGVTVGASELSATQSLYFGEFTDAAGVTHHFLGNDQVVAGAGNDVISAGRGDDSVTGGLGADLLTGDLGADTFVYASPDELQGDRVDGGVEKSTLDTLRLAPLSINQTFDLALAEQLAYIDEIVFGADQFGTRLILDGNQTTGTVTTHLSTAAYANANMDNNAGDLAIRAAVALAEGVDIDARALITGQSIVMSGTNFNGYDRIWGGTGNDQIDAGAGNDVLHYTGGNDTLTGGAGQDVFSVAASAIGRMTVTDFVSGIDRIDLGAFSGVSNLSIQRTANDSDTLFTFMSGTEPTGLEILVKGMTTTTAVDPLSVSAFQTQFGVIG